MGDLSLREVDGLVAERRTRRALVREAAAALVWGGAGAGLALAGCARAAAGPAAGSAAPAAQQTTVVLGMRAWGVGSGATGSPRTIDQVLYDATQPWRATHPGVDIRIIENTGGPGAVIAAILAGTGPDIYHSWHPNIMFATGGVAADLGPYIKQANADVSVFNKAQMDLFVTPTGTLALPYYLGIQTMAVNEGLLDQLGLAYPSAGWSYQDYAQLVTSIARSASSGTKRVYGCNYGLGNLGAAVGTVPPACILQGFGASYVAPSDPTRANVAAPGAVQAFEWVYGLARVNAVVPPNGSADLGAGTLAIDWAPSFFLPQAATGWKALKWRYYPMPTFPATGAATGCTSDLWAMNPATKNADLAWDLLHWCTFEPDWQRSQMEIFLLSPALLSLWDEWLTRVPQIAPPLADKNLQAFADLARGNRAYPQQFFRYAAPQADALTGLWGQRMWAQQVDVAGGLAQLAEQIDSLEQSAQVEAAAGTNAAKAFPTQGATVAPVPAGI